MKNKNELNILKKEVLNSKHCDEEQRKKEIFPLELSITKCPLECDNCKTVYSNKLTGFRIICKCNCHENSKWSLVKRNGDVTHAVNL